MIEIDSKVQGFGIKFPTNVDEISVDDFNIMTNNVKLPPYYCIVALCLYTKLFDFVASVNSTKDTDVSVVPILAKISSNDAAKINATVGDRIIIDRTTIERGVHINIPTIINSKNAQRFFAKDSELSKAIISKRPDTIGKYLNSNNELYANQSPSIIVLEFKIIPCNDISAAIAKNNNSNRDVFLVKAKE